MTEDQIKAIAEEFANSSINEYSTGVDKDAAKSLASDLKQFLTFLSTRYCIVERKKVMKAYRKNSFFAENPMNPSDCYYQGVIDTLTNLFGTSMFQPRQRVIWKK